MAWSPFEALRILSPTPMLLVTPENDSISSMAQQKELIMDRVEGPKQMHIVWGKEHMDVLDGDSFFPAMATQINFIRKYFDD
jgi:hypothetical protein